MTHLKKYTSSLSGKEKTWYYCGCYVENKDKEKIYLKSNIDYNQTHLKHKGRCLYKITEA